MKQGVLDNRIKILGSGDQFGTPMNGHSALVSSSFSWMAQDGASFGSIHAVPSAAYVGTTATLSLKGSNDNVNFGTVFQDDGITPVSFTFTTALENKMTEINRILYKYYQLDYDAGDASAGTIMVNIIFKK